VKRAAQVLALAAVAGLLGLLIWRVATEPKSEIPRADLAAGKRVLAPRFALERIDRKGKLSLASLRGKAVVINFWASWCAPCKEEAPILRRVWREHRADGLVVVSVDYNDFDRDARRFARDVRWTFPIVRDRQGKVLTRYGGTGVPETYVVDRDGFLVGQPFEGSLKGDEARFDQTVARALQA
jgi:cytochrome c biogenesis protein CcmG, thiol:disulfide interchange protein DsbE